MVSGRRLRTIVIRTGFISIGVDPRRPMPEEFPHRPVETPAEDEDPPRVCMLQGRQMGKEFRLRPFGFEGKGVVGENGDLSGVGFDRDPPVGGVPGIEEPGMIPGRHPPVQGRGLPEEDRHQGRKAGGNAAATEGALFLKRNRAAIAAMRLQAKASGKFWIPHRRQRVARSPPAKAPALSIP